MCLGWVSSLWSCLRKVTLDQQTPPQSTAPLNLSHLFSLSTNHNSLIFQRYHHLLPQIAQIACPPTIPHMDLAHYFLTTLSPHSAHGHLKQHCTHTVKTKLHNHMFEHEHTDFHLLPGILSTQTSYPIIRMSRSVIKHRISPLSFLICIRRKLRLPLIHQTHVAHADTTTTMTLATTPSAVTKAAR